MLDFVTRERKTLLASEAVFLLFFVLWAVLPGVRFPGISHTEQPMDFGFLNASIQTYFGQPEDQWLRGEPVSYYYFGYWMMGVVSQLTGVTPSVSYNLALALVPALAAMAVFGLVFNIVRSEARRWRSGGHRRTGGPRSFSASPPISKASWSSCGPTAWARRVSGAGPGSTVSTDTPRRGPTAGCRRSFWWWWAVLPRPSTRSTGPAWTDFTIQEFPPSSASSWAISTRTSMSIPFALMFLAFCWNIFKTPGDALSRTCRLGRVGRGDGPGARRPGLHEPVGPADVSRPC